MSSSITRPPSGEWPVILLISVLSCSLGLNVVLALKYRALTTPRAAGIRAGIVFKTIPTVDPAGTKGEVRLDSGQPSVIYVMSPACDWCARNLNNIRTLARASGSRYRFIGLSITAAHLREYLLGTPLPFPVLSLDADRLPAGFDASATPQMAIVGPGGRVEKVWVGALDGARKADVEKIFHVGLPGMAPASAPKIGKR